MTAWVPEAIAAAAIVTFAIVALATVVLAIGLVLSHAVLGYRDYRARRVQRPLAECAHRRQIECIVERAEAKQSGGGEA